MTVQTVSAIGGNISAYVGLGGNVVRLHLGNTLEQSELPSTSIIATLPSNLRPRNATVAASWYNQTGQTRYLSIKPDGAITLFNNATGDNYVSFDATYLI